MPESTISKGYYSSNTIDAFEKLLARWVPEDLDDRRRSSPKTEKGWERSLVEHLRAALPGDLNVIPQGGSGMKHGDIVVERKTILGGINRDIVELKLGLATTAQYQRLIGQVDDYRKESGNTIVVICGDNVDPKLMKSLETRYPRGTERLGVFWKGSAKEGVERVFPREGGSHVGMFQTK